jgi:hypothetical protein
MHGTKALLDAYLDQESKKAVTPEAARKLYDETVKGISPESEVRARHILVENEDDGQEGRAARQGRRGLRQGRRGALQGPGSKGEGGDLGFFTKDRMVEPFAETAFKLEAGQISDPVKSQFGWHVIKVEEKRNKPVPSFEETKDQIDTYLGRKAQQDLILGCARRPRSSAPTRTATWSSRRSSNPPIRRSRPVRSRERRQHRAGCARAHVLVRPVRSGSTPPSRVVWFITSPSKDEPPSRSADPLR